MDLRDKLLVFNAPGVSRHIQVAGCRLVDGCHYCCHTLMASQVAVCTMAGCCSVTNCKISWAGPWHHVQPLVGLWIAHPRNSNVPSVYAQLWIGASVPSSLGCLRPVQELSAESGDLLSHNNVYMLPAV
jgi:hypothetical protein